MTEMNKICWKIVRSFGPNNKYSLHSQWGWGIQYQEGEVVEGVNGSYLFGFDTPQHALSYAKVNPLLRRYYPIGNATLSTWELWECECGPVYSIDAVPAGGYQYERFWEAWLDGRSNEAVQRLGCERVFVPKGTIVTPWMRLIRKVPLTKRGVNNAFS